jgi:hypothetical protein
MNMNELKNIQNYKSKIRSDHKSRAVRAYFDLYAWFWFHTEFWIKDPGERRPYTFIMRDWIYPHFKWFLMILALWYIGMICWAIFTQSLANELSCLIISSLSGWIAAHLIWGSKWIPNEQEEQPYLGE